MMDTTEREQLLFPSEAADILGISVPELARLRRQGRVKAEELPGNRKLTMYRASDLRKAELKKKRGRPRKDKPTSS